MAAGDQCEGVPFANPGASWRVPATADAPAAGPTATVQATAATREGRAQASPFGGTPAEDPVWPPKGASTWEGRCHSPPMTLSSYGSNCAHRSLDRRQTL